MVWEREPVGGNRKRNIGIGFYAAILLLSLLPVPGFSILEGSAVNEWVCRVRQACFYPDAGTLSTDGIPYSALCSGLLHLPFHVLYRMCGSLNGVYVVFAVCLQAATFCGAARMFQKAFAGEGYAEFFGVLLYMLNPYRLYLCYDEANLAAAMVWMLLPFLMEAVLDKKEGADIKTLAEGGIALALIGYADAVYFFVIGGLLLLYTLIAKRWKGLLLLLTGTVIFAPGLAQVCAWLFTARFEALGITTQSIMEQGYALGQMFYSYTYESGRPGMGAGLFGALLAALWLKFVAADDKPYEAGRYFTAFALLLLVLSLRWFPWDVVERVGSFAARFVTFCRTPALFFGLAQASLCFPAAWGMGRMCGRNEKVLRLTVPAAVAVICAALAVWQCNGLTYGRMPLF